MSTIDNNKSRIQNITDLLKVVLWPIIVVVIILIFWRPLYLTLNRLPDVLNKSEAITIGSLSIKLEKKIISKPTEEVQNVLKELSATSVETLIYSNGTTNYYHESEMLYRQKQFSDLIE